MGHSGDDPIVGIDLGTSNSVVAHCDDAGLARVLVDPHGNKVHPSVVSFHPNGSVIVGAAAKQRRIIDPTNTVYSAKRLIGRAYASPQVQRMQARVPYVIREGQNQTPLVVSRAGEFAPQEISAMVLDHVRDIAANALDVGVNRAVLTVPASFTEAQRSATATAGAIAGITVVRVLNEPTAAALAYGHSRQMPEIFAVYDLGGGTFDVTILRLVDQVYEVLGTAGDAFLGGDDFDEALVEMLIERFLREQRVDLRNNPLALMRVRAVAEQAKVELSRRARATIRIEELAYGANGAPIHFELEVTREEFVQRIRHLVAQTFAVCNEACQLAGIPANAIGEVILVGGATKTPYVREQVAQYFGQGPRTDANPEEAVALGASLQAKALQRLLDRTRGGTGRISVPIPMRLPAQPTLTAGSSEAVTLPSPARARSNTERPSTRGGASDRISDVIPTPVPAGAAVARITPRAARPSTVPPPVPGPVASPRSATTARRITIPPLPSDEGVSGAGERPRTPTGGYPLAPGPGASSGERPRTPTGGYPLAPGPGASSGERSRTPTGGYPQAPGPGASSGERSRTPTGGYPLAAGGHARNQTLSGFEAGSPPVVTVPPREPVAAHDPLQPEPWPGPLPVQPSAFSPAPPAVGFAVPSTSLPKVSVAAVVPPAPATADASVSSVLAPTSASSAPTLLAAANPEFASASQRARRPSMAGDGVSPSQYARGVRGTTVPPPYEEEAAVLAPHAPGAQMRIVDVMPHAFGIGTVGGYCEHLIARNTQLPAERRRVFSPSREGQSVVRIRICQGPARRLDENVVLGDLVLELQSQRARGDTQIEVAFAIGNSGILQVRAVDLQTGLSQSVALEIAGGLTRDQVQASHDRMRALRNPSR